MLCAQGAMVAAVVLFATNAAWGVPPEVRALEKRGDEHWRAAQPYYQLEHALWGRLAKLAASSSPGAVARARESQERLTRVLRDPRLAARPTTKARDAKPDVDATRLVATEASVPMAETLKKVTRFLIDAEKYFMRLSERDERERLLLLEMTALLHRFAGDGHQRTADVSYQAALNALGKTSQPEHRARAMLYASRARLHYKLRQIEQAWRLVIRQADVLSSLCGDEETRHLLIARDLARFSGDEAIRLLRTLPSRGRT